MAIKNNESPSGCVLLEYKVKPVEYIYGSNFKELISPLQDVDVQETVGNYNFHREKMAFIKFIRNRLEDKGDTTESIRYIIRALTALPEHVITGSDIINGTINRLPTVGIVLSRICSPGTGGDAECKDHDIRVIQKQETNIVLQKET